MFDLGAPAPVLAIMALEGELNITPAEAAAAAERWGGRPRGTQPININIQLVYTLTPLNEPHFTPLTPLNNLFTTYLQYIYTLFTGSSGDMGGVGSVAHAKDRGRSMDVHDPIHGSIHESVHESIVCGDTTGDTVTASGTATANDTVAAATAATAAATAADAAAAAAGNRGAAGYRADGYDTGTEGFAGGNAHVDASTMTGGNRTHGLSLDVDGDGEGGGVGVGTCVKWFVRVLSSSFIMWFMRQ